MDVEISGALYECLHQFEVVLRNAIDEQLCTWNGAQKHQPSGTPHARDWLMDPSHLLQRLTGDDIPKALRRARAALRAESRAPGHADVLAQLSFGTWRFCFPTATPAAGCCGPKHSAEPSRTSRADQGRLSTTWITSTDFGTGSRTSSRYSTRRWWPTGSLG